MPSLSLSAKWAKLGMKLQKGRPVHTILLESGLGKQGLVFKNFVFASWEINGFPMAFSTSCLVPLQGIMEGSHVVYETLGQVRKLIIYKTILQNSNDRSTNPH